MDRLNQQFKNIEKFKELEKERLNPLTPGLLHTENKFEYCYCRDGFHGKKKELIMRYVLFENMNISNLDVANQTVFNNCVFENVKFKKCKFNEVVFINCLFTDSAIIECSLETSMFINCINLETTMIIENAFDNSVVKGSALVRENLENDQNQLRNMTIDSEPYSILEENNSTEVEETEIKNNMATLPSKEIKQETEKTDMNTQNIISKKTFQNEKLTLSMLENKLFDNCNFLNCSFEESISLTANTDFIKCNFEGTNFSSGLFDKVAFDESVFSEVIFQADFTRCNFAKCTFHECNVMPESHFFTCNFDFSNAYNEFGEYQEQFTDVIFNPEKESDAELQNSNHEVIYNQFVLPLYQHLLETDKVLQEKISVLEQQADLNDENVDDYLLQLNDFDFMQFISRVTLKRSQNSMQKDDASEEKRPLKEKNVI